MRRLVAALAFVMLISSPALAQSSKRPANVPAVTPFVSAPWLFGTYAQSPPEAIGSRETAMAECNADARRYSQMTYGHQEIDYYRACMARKGHTE